MNRSVLSTLRGKTVNRFNRSAGGSHVLQSILQRSQFQKKRSLVGVKEKSPELEGGLRLSDPSDSENDDGPSTSAKALQKIEKKKTSTITSSNHEASRKAVVDLKTVHDNLQLMEEAKANMLKYQRKPDSQKEHFNIAELLALGETGETTPQESHTSKKASQNNESDSEWEEVEGKRLKIRSYLKILKKYEYNG